MLTLDQFIAKHKKPLDYDGSYGPQCVDLALAYCVEVLGVKPLGGHAYQWYRETSHFEKIPKSQLRRGDLVIYRSALPGSHGNGHIEIFYKTTSPTTFIAFSQAWGGNYPHFVSHNYNWVLGGIRLKSRPAPPKVKPKEHNEMIDRDGAIIIHRLLRPNQEPSKDFVNALAGRKTYKNYLPSVQKEIADRDGKLKSQRAELARMRETINKLNQTVVALNQSDANNKAVLQQHLTTIADLTAKLENGRDSVEDITKPPALPPPSKPKTHWLDGLLKLFAKKK